MALNPKQRRFVAEYLKDLNATEAAKRCGYSEQSARSQGARLLTDADISLAVADSQRQQIDSLELTAARVMEELRRLAFVDLRGYFDEHGNLKPMQNLTHEQGAALAGVEVVIKNAAAGDGVTDTIHKIKLWDKPKALEMLCKRFGLLVDRLEVTGGLDLSNRLTAARDRLKKS